MKRPTQRSLFPPPAKPAPERVEMFDFETSDDPRAVPVPDRPIPEWLKLPTDDLS